MTRCETPVVVPIIRPSARQRQRQHESLHARKRACPTDPARRAPTLRPARPIMRSSVVTHAERQNDRLAHACRHAALHATPAERIELERLSRLVRLGHLPVAEALTTLADLRSRQCTRSAAGRGARAA